MNDDFLLFPFPLLPRLIIAGFMFFAGLALSLVLDKAPWLGFFVEALGWLPLLLKPASNKPQARGLSQWQAVPPDEVKRIMEELRRSELLGKKISRMGKHGRADKLGKSFLKFLPFLAFFLVAFLVFAYSNELNSLASLELTILFYLFGLVVALIPAFAFGRVSVYRPPELSLKMPCFSLLFDQELPPGVGIAAYLNFDKDKQGRDIPQDIRIMYELKRPPEGLVGIQVQAAINKGPSGAVPYLYAVVICRGRSSPAYAKAAAFEAKGYEIEASGDGDYASVVIRQETTGTGYETSNGDCLELYENCMKLLAGLPETAA